METVLTLKGITKSYPGVIALDNLSFNLRKGEIHSLLGENGAGKSTMIKIISGAIEPDIGEINVFGHGYKAMTPALAKKMGIAVIYQEYNLISDMSAAENISLGDKSGYLVNYKELNSIAEKVFDTFKIKIDPTALIKDLSPGQQQIVEISKAITKDARILIMDEPTAPLTMEEVDHLFKIIDSLRKNGVSIIYITHRMDEVFAISDRVTIMRDGQYIDTVETKNTNRKELVNMMVGRELLEIFPQSQVGFGENALEVKNLTGTVCKNVSFNVRKGEILGISGLAGAGRTEIARTIYGADKTISGEIWVNGKRANIKSPSDAIREGIGLIPEDRKNQGCFLDMSIRWNCSIMNIRNLSKGLVVDTNAENENGEFYKKLLNIKVPNMSYLVNTLSGGNQQKVVLAKVLAANTQILIFDEPTLGIDVGTKQEIYILMRELADKGHAIIMISSDMEELLGMSDRIVVVAEGKITGELQKSEFAQNKVLEMASTH